MYTAVWNGIVVGGRLYIERYGMVLWLEGDFIYSGMELYCGWREIVYTAVWNVIVAGWRLYKQRYGMVFWLQGDCIYSGMEWYCSWREILYTAVWNGVVVGGRFPLIFNLHTLRWVFGFMHKSLNVGAYKQLVKRLTVCTEVYSVTYIPCIE